MANTTAKAQASHRELIDLLTKQVAATLPVVTASFDSDGNPISTLSADATPAFGEKVVVIRTKPIVWAEAKDVLGNAAITYGPHVIQICTEKNFEGTTDNILDILGPAELLPIIVEAGRKGHNVEWYRTANGTVPSAAAMTAANLAATWQNLYWNIQSAN